MIGNRINSYKFIDYYFDYMIIICFIVSQLFKLLTKTCQDEKYFKITYRNNNFHVACILQKNCYLSWF